MPIMDLGIATASLPLTAQKWDNKSWTDHQSPSTSLKPLDPSLQTGTLESHQRLTQNS